MAEKLTIKPADFTKPKAQWQVTQGNQKKVFDTIHTGVPGTAMAPFQFDEEERWALTYYVLHFSKG